MTRWLGRDYVEIYEKDHTKLKKLDLNVDKNAFLYVFLLRLLFIIPPRIVNLAAGLSKMRFKEYILSSTLGAIPVLFISILLIKSYQLKEFHLFILSLISFVLLIFLSYLLIKKFRKDYKKSKSGIGQILYNFVIEQLLLTFHYAAFSLAPVEMFVPS